MILVIVLQLTVILPCYSTAATGLGVTNTSSLTKSFSRDLTASASDPTLTLTFNTQTLTASPSGVLTATPTATLSVSRTVTPPPTPTATRTGTKSVTRSAKTRSKATATTSVSHWTATQTATRTASRNSASPSISENITASLPLPPLRVPGLNEPPATVHPKHRRQDPDSPLAVGGRLTSSVGSYLAAMIAPPAATKPLIMSRIVAAMDACLTATGRGNLLPPGTQLTDEGRRIVTVDRGGGGTAATTTAFFFTVDGFPSPWLNAPYVPLPPSPDGDAPPDEPSMRQAFPLNHAAGAAAFSGLLCFLIAGGMTAVVVLRGTGFLPHRYFHHPVTTNAAGLLMTAAAVILAPSIAEEAAFVVTAFREASMLQLAAAGTSVVMASTVVVGAALAAPYVTNPAKRKDSGPSEETAAPAAGEPPHRDLLRQLLVMMHERPRDRTSALQANLLVVELAAAIIVAAATGVVRVSPVVAEGGKAVLRCSAVLYSLLLLTVALAGLFFVTRPVDDRLKLGLFASMATAQVVIALFAAITFQMSPGLQTGVRLMLFVFEVASAGIPLILFVSALRRYILEHRRERKRIARAEKRLQRQERRRVKADPAAAAFLPSTDEDDDNSDSEIDTSSRTSSTHELSVIDRPVPETPASQSLLALPRREEHRTAHLLDDIPPSALVMIVKEVTAARQSSRPQAGGVGAAGRW